MLEVPPSPSDTGVGLLTDRETASKHRFSRDSTAGTCPRGACQPELDLLRVLLRRRDQPARGSIGNRNQPNRRIGHFLVLNGHEYLSPIWIKVRRRGTRAVLEEFRSTPSMGS